MESASTTSKNSKTPHVVQNLRTVYTLGLFWFAEKAAAAGAAMAGAATEKAIDLIAVAHNPLFSPQCSSGARPSPRKIPSKRSTKTHQINRYDSMGVFNLLQNLAWGQRDSCSFWCSTRLCIPPEFPEQGMWKAFKHKHKRTAGGWLLLRTLCFQTSRCSEIHESLIVGPFSFYLTLTYWVYLLELAFC